MHTSGLARRGGAWCWPSAALRTHSAAALVVYFLHVKAVPSIAHLHSGPKHVYTACNRITHRCARVTSKTCLRGVQPIVTLHSVRAILSNWHNLK